MVCFFAVVVLVFSTLCCDCQAINTLLLDQHTQEEVGPRNSDPLSLSGIDDTRADSSPLGEGRTMVKDPYTHGSQ